MRYSQEEKAMFVSGWKESGKSAWKHAKENGLNPQTLINWINAEKEPQSCFVELPPDTVYAQRTQPISTGAEILIEKGDVKIHIPLVLSRDELRAVMEGLGQHYDTGFACNENISAPRDYRPPKGGKRPDGHSAGGNAAGSIQREHLFVL